MICKHILLTTFCNELELISIWPKDRNQSDVTTPNQSGPGALPSDSLMSYPGHLFGGGSYPSTEMQSMYYTALAKWTKIKQRYQD